MPNLRRLLTAVTMTSALAVAAVPANAVPAPERTAEPRPFVPGEVIVRFAADARPADRTRAAAEAEAELARDLALPRTKLVEVDAGVRSAITELEADPAVRYAEPNYLRQVTAVPNDPLFGQLWGLQNTGQAINGTGGVTDADIDAPEAWDIERGDPATVIAVIDTGTDPSHPDLAPQLWENPGESGSLASNGVDDDANGLVDDRRGWDFLDDDSDPHDEEGHGTHVAGTILARGDDGVGVTGVSQRAALMSLRVCGSYEGDGCPDAAILDAIEYAGEMGADVVNGSLGGPGGSQAIADAIAANPQTLFVWAAGNGGDDSVGDDNDLVPQYPCQADEAPGFDAANSLCVAATNRSDALAGFSNFGDRSVDLAAPGTTVLSSSANRRLFTETFEASDFSSRWTNDSGDTWARTNESPLSSFGVTDSPGSSYVAGKTNAVTSQAFSLPAGYGACALSYYRSINLASGDTFRIDVLRNGAVASSLTLGAGSNGARRSFFELDHDFDAGGAIQIRLVLVANADTAVANGVHMDDIALDCAGNPSDGGYEFLQGTSMATPHVAGAAGLLASHVPAAGAADLRAALLGSVDPLASLAGKTATGGRLNARRALETVAAQPPSPPAAEQPPSPAGGAAESSRVPDTRIDKRPAKRTTQRRVRFAFSADEPGARFECRLNRGSYAPCTSPTRVRAKRGRNVFSVRATNGGRTDPTPASARFRVRSR